jgi:ribosomal protein L11 methyltransferase
VRSFVVTVPASDAELAADRLFALGAAAVEEWVAADGTVELRTHVGDADAAIAAAAAALDPAWPWRVDAVDEAVADTWRRHATSVAVTDRVAIVPAWLDDARRVNDARHHTVVRIDPGAAFGMGDHPTTLLTLRRALAYLDGLEAAGRSAEELRVLDVGSGSGVLSVAVAQAGAGRVDAIDHLPAAVEATHANAERNQVGERVTASTTALGELTGPYDLVLANLLAPALRELAADLVRVTAPAGTLVISGLLADRFDDVVAALTPLAVVTVEELDGWVAIDLARSGGP